MARLTAPNLGLFYGWTPRDGSTPGESGWGASMSENLKLLDAITQISVLSAILPAPAVTTNGTRYIVPATGATGDFLGQAGKLAVRVADAWVFYTPRRGWLADVVSPSGLLKYDGAAWVDAAAPVSAILDVSNPGGWTMANGTAWITVQMFTKTEEVGVAWGASTYKFTPTVSGMYMVSGFLRPVRVGTNAMPANTTLSLGFGSASADGPDVVTLTSADLEIVTLTFAKPMRLVAGTAYYLFGKHSAAAAIAFTYAGLKAVRISA